MKPILVLTAGEFGHAAGRRLSTMLRDGGCEARCEDLVAGASHLETLLAGVPAVAVMAWRPYIHEFRRIDDALHRSGTPWTLAMLRGSRLTCGPAVVPGQGPCYQCFERRWASHHPGPERELVLERAYARDPSLGLQGFIGPMVEAAASCAHEVLRHPTRHAGHLRVVDVLTGVVLETSVLGIHACPRCGIAHPGPTGARFTARLQPVVGELMS